MENGGLNVAKVADGGQDAQHKIRVSQISMAKSESAEEDFLSSAISKKCLPEGGV